MNHLLTIITAVLVLGACSPEREPASNSGESRAVNPTLALKAYLRDIAAELEEPELHAKAWNAFPVPGGIVELIMLEVKETDSASQEKIVLVRSSLDKETFDFAIKPLASELYIAFAYSVETGWSKSERTANLFAGKVDCRRLRQDRWEYGKLLSGKGAAPTTEVFTAHAGKLVTVETKRYPSRDEAKEKAEELGDEQYKTWAKAAMAWPDGMQAFEPSRQWITLAELIRGKEPKWKEGFPPTGGDELTELQQSTPPITLGNLKAWLNTD